MESSTPSEIALKSTWASVVRELAYHGIWMRIGVLEMTIFKSLENRFQRSSCRGNDVGMSALDMQLGDEQKKRFCCSVYASKSAYHRYVRAVEDL